VGEDGLIADAEIRTQLIAVLTSLAHHVSTARR
jgi:hypothetical protein